MSYLQKTCLTRAISDCYLFSFPTRTINSLVSRGLLEIQRNKRGQIEYFPTDAGIAWLYERGLA